MYTGKRTTNLAREFVEWNGDAQILCCPYGPCGDADSSVSGVTPVQPWADASAQAIRGTFGDQFHQFVDAGEELYVATHDLGIYRHWRMQNAGSVSAPDTYSVQGIDLLRFQWAPGTMGNASVDPVEAASYRNNGPSGVVNQSLCEWGAPVFVSTPNFYGASESLREGVTGLDEHPTHDAHGTWLGVEPVRERNAAWGPLERSPTPRGGTVPPAPLRASCRTRAARWTFTGACPSMRWYSR